MKLRSKPLKDGTTAPDFTLPDQHGNPVNLKEQLADGAVILFFYPKAFTPVCTDEVCGFRDAFQDFADAGARLIGVSADPPEQQQAFAEKHGITFPLLSDEQTEVYGLYGLRASARAQLVNDRVTFVIDRDQKVRHHATGAFSADPHVQESLAVLRRLAAEG